MIRGGLFTRYYLEEGIRETEAYKRLDPGAITSFSEQAASKWRGFCAMRRPNEAETEAEFIFPVINLLGWQYLPQQEPGRGRKDVPDALLFLSRQRKDTALRLDHSERFRYGSVVVENEARDTLLDRASAGHESPSSQALRYLKRADGIPGSSVQWALLTNGRFWRLYWTNARSRAEGFVELELPALFDTLAPPVPAGAPHRNAGAKLVEYAGVSPRRGVLTGFNEAFVIDGRTRDRLIRDDPRSEEVIKPYLRGQDIDRWASDWAGQWMIFTRHGTDIDAYPAIRAHLARFRGELEPKPADWRPRKSDEEWPGRKPGNYKWYEIQDNVAYWRLFGQPKLAYNDITWRSQFCIDRSAALVNNTVYFLPAADAWLVACLNAAVGWWFSWRKAQHAKDEALRYFNTFVEDTQFQTREVTLSAVPSWFLVYKQSIAKFTLPAASLPTGTAKPGTSSASPKRCAIPSPSRRTHSPPRSARRCRAPVASRRRRSRISSKNTPAPSPQWPAGSPKPNNTSARSTAW